ncbi:MAG: RlmE family RNA methyltransferase [Thermoplasmata archaeon]
MGGRRFVAERRRDPFYREAQRRGLRSRAAFKLAFLADRFPLFAPGARVLDLGAAPGGWSLVALERTSPGGTVVAVDPRPVDPAPNLRYVPGRVGDPSLAERLGPEPFDVVIADLSPRISGAWATDHARSAALVIAAAELAHEVLRDGGAFVAKIFDGDLRPEVEDRLARWFRSVARTKPPASRSQSSELYLVARGHRTDRPERRSGSPRDPIYRNVP